MSTVAEMMTSMPSIYTPSSLVSMYSSSIPTASSTTYSTPTQSMHSLHMGTGGGTADHSKSYDSAVTTATASSSFGTNSSWPNSNNSPTSQIATESFLNSVLSSLHTSHPTASSMEYTP